MERMLPNTNCSVIGSKERRKVKKRAYRKFFQELCCEREEKDRPLIGHGG